MSSSEKVESTSASADYEDNSNNALTRLEQLACFPTIKNMIQAGASVPEICRFIREDAKEALDITEKSLRNRLYRFLEKNSKDCLREQVPRPHLALYQEQVEQIEVIKGLDLCLAITLDRIMMDYTIEKKLGKTMSSTTSALKVLNELIKTKYQFEEGIRTQHKSSATESWDAFMANARENYRARYGDSVANIVFDPASRRRIVNALERVKRNSSKDFIEVMKKKRRALGLPEEDLEHRDEKTYS